MEKFGVDRMVDGLVSAVGAVVWPKGRDGVKRLKVKDGRRSWKRTRRRSEGGRMCKLEEVDERGVIGRLLVRGRVGQTLLVIETGWRCMSKNW